MTEAAPIPQGDYIAAKRHGTLIFTAGMTPRLDGVLIATGPVRKEDDFDLWRAPVVLACENALLAARAVLGPTESITGIVNMTVYVAAEPGFTAHSRIADFASDHLRAELGDAGRCARCTVGVASLPGNAPVEISLIAAV